MKIISGSVYGADFKFSNQTILTKDDRIESIDPAMPGAVTESDDILDASDCYVIPGLTDVHFHGCVNHDFCDADFEGVHTMAQYELQNGITTICPATMTLGADTLSAICRNGAAYHNANPEDGAELIGINLEGPFIAMSKKGAQNPAFVQKANPELLKHLQEDAEGLVRLVTIAPEEEGALDCIRKCSSEYHFSLGHTSSDYDTASKAFQAGADHVTHLYNAMPPFVHRAPGVIGAAFDAPQAKVELICDGIHIHPSVIRATFQLFGDDRVVLISDSMMATGMPDGDYSLGGLPTRLVGHKVTLEDGTIAGSATNLMDCMRNVVSCGVPLESAIKAAAWNPVNSIGMTRDYGSIEKGKKANLVILDKNLQIRHIIHDGRLVK